MAIQQAAAAEDGLWYPAAHKCGNLGHLLLAIRIQNWEWPCGMKSLTCEVCMSLEVSENLTELEDIFLVSLGNCSITHLSAHSLCICVCLCIMYTFDV